MDSKVFDVFNLSGCFSYLYVNYSILGQYKYLHICFFASGMKRCSRIISHMFCPNIEPAIFPKVLRFFLGRKGI